MYECEENLVEPLDLEPEDYSKKEWLTICKVFDKDPVNCKRISVTISKLESFTD